MWGPNYELNHSTIEPTCISNFVNVKTKCIIRVYSTFLFVSFLKIPFKKEKNTCCAKEVLDSTKLIYAARPGKVALGGVKLLVGVLIQLRLKKKKKILKLLQVSFE